MVKPSDIKGLKLQRGAIVVATGGHLEQALRRSAQLELQKQITFFTPRNSQSESKLKDYKHYFVHNVGSRDIIGLVRAGLQLFRLLRKRDFDYVLSTGAGVAIASAVVCKLRNIDFYYIESIARQNKPSMTGRILEKFKSANLYSESKNFDSRRWNNIDSFFSDYEMLEELEVVSTSSGLKLFITVGTVHKFQFKRLVDLVESALLESDSVVWQVGNLESEIQSGQVHKEMTDSEFSRNLRSADVVISHAGVGSILNTLDAGKYPILIPRLSKHDEHIDDHQFEIASLVASFNLAQVVTDKLTREDLLAAKRRQIKVLNKD